MTTKQESGQASRKSTNGSRSASTLTLAQLRGLTITKNGVVALLEATDPPQLRPTTQGAAIVEALDNLFAVWSRLLGVDGVDLESVEQVLLQVSEGDSALMEPTRVRILTQLVRHFDVVIRAYFAAEQSGSIEVPQALRSRQILERIAPREMYQGSATPLVVLRDLSALYLGTVLLFQYVRLARLTPIGHRLGRMDQLAHESLLDLARRGSVGGPPELAVLRWLMLTSAVSVATFVYSDSVENPLDHPIGPFTAIRLNELHAIASRDAALTKRYGAKHLEKVFEHQLALIVQSFGFVVVSTRIGIGTVDLVCISSDPTEPFTFIVEAKTSAQPYTLPTKDSRALVDYVSDVRRTLTALPPLGFVLIVGAGASSTVPNKLAALESRTGTPVRFIRAKSVAALRERLVGPFPLRMFRDSVIAGDKVLPTEFVEDLLKSWHTEQEAYRQFAEALFAARGVIRARAK